MIDAKRETNLRTALAGEGKVSVGGRTKETSMRSPLTFEIWKIHHDGSHLANSKKLSPGKSVIKGKDGWTSRVILVLTSF